MKRECQMYPKIFMIDDADQEIAAIKAVYGTSIKILICFWHVQRAWRRNIVKKVRKVLEF